MPPPAARDGEAVRRLLLQQVRARPGLTKNALARATGLHWNAVRHHVGVLARRGLLQVRDQGWSHQVFVAGIPPEHLGLVRALRDPALSPLLDALLARPDGATARELAGELRWGRKKALARLARLEAEGLVRRVGPPRPGPVYKPVALPADLDGLRRHLGYDDAPG